MSLTITRDQAVQLLEEVVTERGADFVYAAVDSGKQCSYLAERKPSCLVGHVFVKAGVPLDVIGLLDLRADGLSDVVETIGVLDAAEVTIPEDAYAALMAAQVAQDGGASWGAALEKAKAVRAVEVQ